MSTIKQEDYKNLRKEDLQTALRWNKAGIIAITLIGSVWHFIYNWSNQSTIIAAIAPVNESVWEHLKLGLWAVILFSFAEYFFIGKRISNYFLAKTISIYIISLTILAVFYSYYIFLHTNIVLVDIASYVLGVYIAQKICTSIYLKVHFRNSNTLGLISLITTTVIVAFLTFYPPHYNIFKDKRFGTYGVEKNK